MNNNNHNNSSSSRSDYGSNNNNHGGHYQESRARIPYQGTAVIGDASLLEIMMVDPPTVTPAPASGPLPPILPTTVNAPAAAAADPNLLMLESLQAQVEALQEANFDLEATMATMQAEQQYSIQQLQDRMNQETQKLQNALRLEQQTKQRLLLQNQQQFPLKRARGVGGGGSSTADAFRKRLSSNGTTNIHNNHGDDDDDDDDDDQVPMEEEQEERHPPAERGAAAAAAGVDLAASPAGGPPPEITMTRGPRPSTGTATTAQTTPLPPSPWPEEQPVVHQKTTNARSSRPARSTTRTGAAWLARQLLYHCPSTTATAASPPSSALDITNVLIAIATTTGANADDDDSSSAYFWNEAQLVEYLLQQQPPGALPYWKQSLTWSRAARRGILQAMQQLEEQQQQGGEDELDEDHDGRTRMLVEETSSKTNQQLPQSRNKPRIHRMNPDGSRGDPVVLPVDNASSSRRQLWYTPGTTKATTAAWSSTFMNPQSIQDWVDRRLDLHDPEHLQLLALVLEDCEPHSTRVWWSGLFSSLTVELIGLHARLTTATTRQQQQQQQLQQLPLIQQSPPTTTNTAPSASQERQPPPPPPQYSTKKRSSLGGAGSSIGVTTTTNAWKDLLGGHARRLRFQPPTVFTTTTTGQDKLLSSPVYQDDLLLACLTLMERLITVTELDILEKWYTVSQEAPRQPFLLEDLSDASEESALLWIGLLLDVMEGLDYYRNDDGFGDPQHHQRPLALPKWYLQLVSLFTTIGQTKGGMKALRTRLPDSSGGEIMHNVLDAATMQLFHLSLSDDDDEGTYINVRHEQRLFVMDYWIRLWHQALFFVTRAHAALRNNQKTAISFRSLLLDLKDYYTSACTRILTDPFVKPEIQSMIRLQLEELVMDDEEHDEWKG